MCTVHGRLGSSRLRYARACSSRVSISLHPCACVCMTPGCSITIIGPASGGRWSAGLSLIRLHAAVRAARGAILPLHQCGLVPSLHSCNGFGLDWLGRTGSGGGRQDRSYPKGLGRHEKDSRAATRSICARPDASASRVRIDVMCRFGSDVMRHFGMSMATRTARLRVPFSASVNVLLLAVSVEWIKSRAEWDHRAGWDNRAGWDGRAGV